MKEEVEEKAALHALGETTNVTGFVDSTSAPPKPAESDDEKVSTDEKGEDKKGENDKEKKGGLRDYARIFSFSDRLDRILYAVALLCSIGAGAALPLMVCLYDCIT